MRIFILKFDDTVEVTESFSDHPYYTHKNYPKGQIFCRKLIGSMGYVWNVLHRSYKGNCPSWVYVKDKHVHEQVHFALMLVD